MNDWKENIVIKTSLTDNVAIVANREGLKRGDIIENDLPLRQNIPMGNKVAMENITKGEAIVRYGQTIGYARQDFIKGDRVNNSMIQMPAPVPLDSIPLSIFNKPEKEKLEGYTFMGYRNPDGTAGTKNILGITTSVQCVAGFAELVADKIKQELLQGYPNVDDVVAFTHNYGCGVAIDVPAAVIPIRTIQNIAKNPNFGGEVLVIGLGCEKLLPQSILLNNGQQVDPETFKESPNIIRIQNEKFVGFQAIMENITEQAEIHLKKLNNRTRELCPVSDLVVGMQCGGSDAFSGITANPVVGYAADLIVRAGGSAIFSEVTEVRDAIHLLVPRAVDKEVGQALLNEMEWYDNYLKTANANTSANPAPGNKLGGISNIVEKALGSVAKSGTSPIVDVLSHGEKLRKKGLVFAATPASDFVCGTLQLAAGMNIHLFTTGRGTPYGLSCVPVIKISSNTKLSRAWYDLIDLNAGQIADGTKTIEEMGWELFHLILDVASGKTKVASDKLGLYNDLALFNPGPLT